MTNMEEKTPAKTGNKFTRFLHRVFVYNWGLKLTAIVTAVVLWLITVGL